MSYVEMPVYSRLDIVVSQSVELLCNTSLTSDITWSYDTEDDYVEYVYWKNGRIYSDKPRLAIKSAGDDVHSLVIADAELNDSGLYTCYGGKGLRKVGYQLIVAGMRSVWCELLLKTSFEQRFAKSNETLTLVHNITVYIVVESYK